MANLNKVILIGRLTRDPEVRTFSNGGRVAKFGFAVNNRKKNSQTGEWEDDPVFLDCEAFNRGETGKMADTVERYLKKGSQAFLEGHLQLDRWDDKTTGEKRQKLKIVIDMMQMLDARRDGGGPPAGRAPAQSVATSPGYDNYEASGGNGPSESGGESDHVPF
jgi:single-strand DNA-binding protein